ncbi:MAG: hypothetical protein O6942_06575 [Bacteroidetes bacterium]|nr:hypothetical protein [Bacteroidota bacterium]
MSPVLLIEAIPDAIEIIVLTIVWLAGGIAGGFFLYRIRNKKELGLFEARKTALGNRETELARIRAAMKMEQRTDNSVKLEATVTLLREELEQQSLEISIAKEEHGLELRILQDEIESLTRRPGETAGFAYEIEDVIFSTESSSEKEPPETAPSVTEPPETAQSVTEPPETAPSVTEPPETAPSETEPPETVPSEKEPPETVSSETEPAENLESVTDWPTNDFSYLFGDVTAESNRNEEEPREKENFPSKYKASPDLTPSEKHMETGDITIPEFPQFKSLVELFPLLKLDEPDSETIEEDKSGSKTHAAGLQMLLGLADYEFRQLRELGFNTYESIAELSSSDISHLSEKFNLPASRVEQIWISGAQLRLFEGG